MFKRKEEEIELIDKEEEKIEREEVKDGSKEKIDSLFNMQTMNKEERDLEEKYRLLEYKIEKIMEQNSRIIDLLEKLLREKNVNMTDINNDEERRLW